MSTEKSNSLPNKKNKFVFLTTGKSLDIPPEKKKKQENINTGNEYIRGSVGWTGIQGWGVGI
ncbi:MAG: hypothetical protein PHF86_08705 [Candidatus Nanoarchaeia archaeon]|jgi:beta-lactamase superfamily II metal-dependent hydrolase|nr:hypothetical protein [Candidatus Nanoarchaeia archaeon]